MRTDDNWKETKLLVKDLEELLGIPEKVSEEYLKVIENLLIHKFIEAVNQVDDPTDHDFQIELPYIGSIVISIDSKNRITTEFSVKNSFYKKIKQAYVYRESPLVDQCEEVLGRDLVDKYIIEGGASFE